MTRPSAPVCIALALACAMPARADDEEAPPTTDDAPADDTKEQSEVDSLADDILEGRWLDPQDPYWAPRRGERLELSALVGGEAAFSALAPDKLPSLGGMIFQGLVRYYPVDRLALVIGARSYFGLDDVPAAGTTASSVLSLVTGVRYDLVRENRFSLLWDLYSGPSLYVFADLPSVQATSEYAIGGEMGTGLALRYTLGPFTAEARGLVGGRAGASSNPFQRADGAGPFSAIYTGMDVGLTWSLQ